MVIRDADPGRDAAACAAIYRPYVSDGVASFETIPPDAIEFARRIGATLESYPWLVGCDPGSGETIGFAYAGRHRERAAYRWAADVSVYIHSDWHRRGVGRQLYSALFELLRVQGLHVLCAGITLPNPASVALHESLGFQPVGVYRRIGWKAGAWWDVGWWELELLPGLAGDGGPPPEPGAPLRLA